MSTRDEAMRAFLNDAGWGNATLVPLSGDASTRRYLRLRDGARQALVMDQPPGAETPPCPPGAGAEERRALGYNAVARLAGADTARFVAAADYLRRLGLSTPEIIAADTRQGFLLIEDLGDALYGDVIAAGGDETALYAAAVEAIARIHTEPAPAALAPDKPLYDFDETALVAETDLLPQWFLPAALGRDIAPDEIEEHRALWRDALKTVLPRPKVFVHRDYHSPNLLWLPGREGARRAGVIDFQDAVAGPRSYDLVSLVEDARRDVAPDLAETMTRHYLDTMAAQGQSLDEAAHRAEMAVMAAQRNTKIVGIFVRLFKRDGKPRYLAHLPRMWRYLGRDLEHPVLAPLKSWYDKKVPAERRGRIEGLNA